MTVARPSKQDINTENNNLNTNNTENTFNFINPDSKRIETMISNNNNLDIKFKKKYLFNMQKENLKILSNYLDKLMINRIESKSENHEINKCNENK